MNLKPHKRLRSSTAFSGGTTSACRVYTYFYLYCSSELLVKPTCKTAVKSFCCLKKKKKEAITILKNLSYLSTMHNLQVSLKQLLWIVLRTIFDVYNVIKSFPPESTRSCLPPSFILAGMPKNLAPTCAYIRLCVQEKQLKAHCIVCRLQWKCCVSRAFLHFAGFN